MTKGAEKYLKTNMHWLKYKKSLNVKARVIHFIVFWLYSY
jgi:hypothetical protein